MAVVKRVVKCNLATTSVVVVLALHSLVCYVSKYSALEMPCCTGICVSRSGMLLLILAPFKIIYLNNLAVWDLRQGVELELNWLNIGYQPVVTCCISYFFNQPVNLSTKRGIVSLSLEREK